GGVQRRRGLAVGCVGANEAHDRDRAGLGDQARDVRGAAYVLPPRRLIEAEVAVEAMAEVVAVEHERAVACRDQPLLDRGRDRRLARAGQPREPHRSSSLAERLPASLTGHARALPAHVRATAFARLRLELLDL